MFIPSATDPSLDNRGVESLKVHENFELETPVRSGRPTLE